MRYDSYEKRSTKNLKLTYNIICVGQLQFSGFEVDVQKLEVDLNIFCVGQLQIWGFKIGLPMLEVGLHYFMCRPSSSNCRPIFTPQT